MKLSGNLILTFILLVVVCSLYRIMPSRPFGFAPQWAMAVFAGAVIKDKKLAFLIPILSMFISDAVYEILYKAGVGNMPGFYAGQITNYILFGSMTIFGFLITKFNFAKVLLASVAAPTAYFFLSNLLVWTSGGGLQRPRTINGLFMTLADGIPFWGWSIASTMIFSAFFFGVYFIMKKEAVNTSAVTA